jgi:putative YphP/YqiW family bacilliredoxin
MPYDERPVQPMREELTQLGVQELRTAEEVDEILGRRVGTTMVMSASLAACP